MPAHGMIGNSGVNRIAGSSQFRADGWPGCSVDVFPKRRDRTQHPDRTCEQEKT